MATKLVKSKQKINKDRGELNNTINQLHIIHIYKLLHPTIAEFTFLSSSHGTFTKINRIGVIHNLKKF